MNYSVIWVPSAEQELAAIWLAATDRNAVTRAAHLVEQRLQLDPANEGESRPKNRRITFEAPISLVFSVHVQTRTVRVLRVRSFGRRT